MDFTAAHFLLPLMRAQRGWGFDVHLACAPGPLVRAIQTEGFPFHPLPIRRSANPLTLFAAYRGLRRLIGEGGYSAVHLHTPVAALVGRPAARGAGAPIVIYTAHGFFFHEAMPAWKRRAHIALERWAQRSADFLMTQSREDAETAVRESIAPAGRVEAIGNGVDPGRFVPPDASGSDRREVAREFGMDPAAPLVVMMGRLVREKGYGDLLEAWARVLGRFPEARLLCVGPALESDRDDFSAEARRLTTGAAMSRSVIFAGMREDVPRLLRAADLFVLPSWREGMPRSILEAMACGRPVVATNIRGCREEVVEGETGLLAPAHDVPALATAITALLGDPARRVAMGAAARRRVEEHFDEQRVIERQEGIYRRLFREKGLAWPSRT